MRSSRRRDLTGKRMKPLLVTIEESVHETLQKIAGPHSYGYTVEQLIKREELRRKKRLERANTITKPN